MLETFAAELGLGVVGVLEADHAGGIHGGVLVKANGVRCKYRGVDAGIEIGHYSLQNVVQCVVLKTRPARRVFCVCDLGVFTFQALIRLCFRW